MAIIDWQTAKVKKQHKLSARYFAEGLALVDNRLIQLSWRARTGFVYDKDSLELQKTFQYNTEGWGLTYNGEYLILSDGSHILYFLSADNFKVVKTLAVTMGGKPVTRLNELEYIDGLIYANVWQSDKVVVIHPISGAVSATIDFRRLRKQLPIGMKVDVLNGIAYHEENGTLLITGKHWPTMFEVKLLP